MQTGTVKWFNSKKGFGFIVKPPGARRDIFVHFTVIQKDGFKALEDGDKVEYEAAEGAKGPYATKVIPLESAAPAA